MHGFKYNAKEALWCFLCVLIIEIQLSYQSIYNNKTKVDMGGHGNEKKGEKLYDILIFKNILGIWYTPRFWFNRVGGERN